MIIFAPEIFCCRETFTIAMVINLCISIITMFCEMKESVSIWKGKTWENWVMCREWTHGGDMPTYLHNSQNVFYYFSSQCAIRALLQLWFFYLLQLVSLTEVMRESKKKFFTLLWILGKGLAKWYFFLYSPWSSKIVGLEVEGSTTSFVLSASTIPSCCQKGGRAFGLTALVFLCLTLIRSG